MNVLDVLIIAILAVWFVASCRYISHHKHCGCNDSCTSCDKCSNSCADKIDI